MTVPAAASAIDRQPPALWVVLRLARHRPAWFLLHITCVTLLAYVLPFLPALVVRAILDRLDGGGAVDGLVWLFIAVSMIKVALGPVQTLSVVMVRRIATVLMRRNMLDHVLHRPGAQALPSSPGEALVRFDKDPESVTHALDFLGDPIGQLLAFVFAFTILGSIDLFLTVVVVAPAVIVMLVVNLATPKVQEARKARQDALGEVSGLLGEIFGGVTSIKAANAEHLVSNRLQELNETRRRTTLHDLLVEQVLQSIATNTATIATGVFLIVAASAARSGRLSVGDVAVFSSYLAWMTTVVRFVGTVMLTLRQTDVSVARMAEVMQDAPARDVVAFHPVHLRGALPPLVEPALDEADRLRRFEAQAVTFRYAEGGRGIEGVDLAIEADELVVVTGRVGAGKTTFVRALLGLLPLDEGELRWNGAIIGEPGAFLVPPRCAYTSQVPRLFSGPLRDNVLLGLERSADELADAAQAAVLDADIGDLDDGWDTFVGPRGVRLSGGQVQRAAAARMFVRRPQLLVVDDLSSALDVVTEERLWTQLFDRGATAIVVSHRRRVLERADRVIVLRDGVVDDVGSLQELRRSSKEMRDLWAGAH